MDRLLGLTGVQKGIGSVAARFCCHSGGSNGLSWAILNFHSWDRLSAVCLTVMGKTEPSNIQGLRVIIVVCLDSFNCPARLAWLLLDPSILHGVPHCGSGKIPVTMFGPALSLMLRLLLLAIRSLRTLAFV
jgi:hypothetical protein